LFEKNSVTTRKKFWLFPESSHTFSEIFLFFSVTTVFPGKTIQTFSGGIQFLSYSVQNWNSIIIILIHCCIFSNNSQNPNLIFLFKTK
jgi:hypothetical protein